MFSFKNVAANLHPSKKYNSLENKLKYSIEKIIENAKGEQRYDLQIQEDHPALSSLIRDDVGMVIAALEFSLVFLQSPCLTFDSETLLSFAWCHEHPTHNRTLGVILRKLIDLELVPLIHFPKGSGSRIRFQINI
jgi:hypothetical protein